MELELKFTIYMLLISSNMDFSLLSPIRMDLKNRHGFTKRQVVQPTWLDGPGGRPKFVDPRVRVSEQNLREAEAIRKAIQATVDSGTFAVDPSQSSSDGGSATPTNNKNPQLPPSLPNAPPLAPTPSPTATDPLAEFHRFWEEFLENSRRFWSWNV